MKRVSRAKSLTILVALIAAIAGSIAGVVISSAGPPRADRAAEDDAPPPSLLNDGQPVSPAQVTLARQQAMRIPTGFAASWTRRSIPRLPRTTGGWSWPVLTKAGCGSAWRAGARDAAWPR